MTVLRYAVIACVSLVVLMAAVVEVIAAPPPLGPPGPPARSLVSNVAVVPNPGVTTSTIHTYGTSSAMDYRYYQVFTTGNYAQGYLMTSVTLRMAPTLTVDLGTEDEPDVRTFTLAIPPVHIFTLDGDGNPDSKLGTAHGPANLNGTTDTFTPDEPVMLQPSTSYAVLLEDTRPAFRISNDSDSSRGSVTRESEGGGTTDGVPIAFDVTSSTTEGTLNDGWTIANKLRSGVGAERRTVDAYGLPGTNYWWVYEDVTGKVMMIRINGYPVDDVAPTLSSAVLAADGYTMTLSFSEDLDADSAPDASAFTVTANGVAVAVAPTDGVTVSGSTVALKLVGSAAAGDTVTLDYAKPDATPIQDVSGNDLAPIQGRAVTNNSTAPVVSIESVHTEHMLGVARPEMRVTRSAASPNALTVNLEITQDDRYLGYTTSTVTIPAGRTSALKVLYTTTFEAVRGNLTTTVAQGRGYRPASAPRNASTIEVLPLPPNPMTAYMDGTHWVVEGGSTKIRVRARLADGVVKPRTVIRIALDVREDVALVNEDYEPLSRNLTFNSRDWIADGAGYYAWTSATLRTLDDTRFERPEQLYLHLIHAPGEMPLTIQCSGDVEGPFYTSREHCWGRVWIIDDGDDIEVTGVDVISTPGVTRVGEDVADTYGRHETIDAVVSLSGSVAVTGLPSFGIMVGTQLRQAYFDGYDRVPPDLAHPGAPEDLSRLRFTYRVRSGDADADGISWGANALSLNGGSIQSRLEQDGDLLVDAVLATPDSASLEAPDDSDPHAVYYEPASHRVDGSKSDGSTLLTAPENAKPGIEGAAKVGETLRATLGSMTSGGDTLMGAQQRWRYQWVRVDGGTETEISGATGKAYALQEADLGKQVRLRVEVRYQRYLNETPPALDSRQNYRYASSSYPVGGTVLAAAAPSVTRMWVSSTPRASAGAYLRGERIRFSVEFSGAVDVTGIPELRIVVGNQVRMARYDTGSGANTLVFSYVVQAGDGAQVHIAITLGQLGSGWPMTALFLRGGASIVAHGTTDPAELTNNHLGWSQSSQPVDGRRAPAATPEATGVSIAAPDEDGDWDAGEHVDVSITFDETVTVDTANGTPSVGVLLGDTVARRAVYTTGSGSDTLTFRYTLASGDNAPYAMMVVAPDSLRTPGGSIRNATHVEASHGNPRAIRVGGPVATPVDDGVAKADDQSGARDAPSRPTVSLPNETTSGVLLVRWHAPRDTGGRTVDSYEVSFNVVAADGRLSDGRASNAPVTHLLARGFRARTTYQVRVRARYGPADALVFGPWSPPAHGTTRAASRNDVAIRLEFPDGSSTTSGTPNTAVKYRIRVSGVHDQSEERRQSAPSLAEVHSSYTSNGGSSFWRSRGNLLDFLVTWDTADSGYVERELQVQSGTDGPHWVDLWQTGSGDARGRRAGGAASMSRLCISVSTDDPCPALSVAAPSPDGAPTLSEAGTDGLWTPGETVEVTVAFTEPVTVGTAVGMPSIGLRLGGSELRSAAYLRGSGASALVFGYTLTESDGSQNSLMVPANSLALNGGTIRSQTWAVDASLVHEAAAVTGLPPQQNQQPQTSNTPATGGPGIDGLPVVGQTLTATTAGIADEDGMTNAVFAYQWIRQDLATALSEEIEGATGSAYTVTAEDEGHVLMVLVTFTDDAGNEESVSSRQVEVTAAQESDTKDSGEGKDNSANTPATGAPGIDGSPVVGQVLTATTSDIGDTNGITNAVFAYQWLADDAAIEGATASTYTAASADVGKALKVRGTFTDDAGSEESLTSAATAAVTQALTASVHSTPASHDGQSLFTFELRFSKTPKEDLSYVTLRDHALEVTGGTVANAQRLEPGKNVRWEITVQPSGNDDVTVSLPVTTDCDAQRAVCTSDGRMLSNSVELVIPGPSSQGSSREAPQESSQENSAATGAPTITGTVQVGETLTAGTLGIADSNGLTSATFAYRWLADDAEISGATGSSYTLTSSEQGKAIKVRVTFTDDAGNAESLTSVATVAVAAAPSPLMAKVHDAPAYHDGSATLTFELRFSEEFSISYKTLRDHAFTVTGGEVVKARRLEQGKNVRWEITVRPSSDADVTIVLPVTTDCDAQGSVCTGDGRMLSRRMELTVSGPSG